MTPSENAEQLKRVQRYRQLVEQYEALDQGIDELIMRHDGGTESMSQADIATYRDLARRRAEAENAMRLLEKQLGIDAGRPDAAEPARR